MFRPDCRFSRRDFVKLSTAGVLSGVTVPWFETLAQAAAVRRPRGKNCILLWMDGGPSQQHTFDPKPGGEFRSAATSVPGIHIVEQLPQLAQCMNDMAILRSMKTDINDHYAEHQAAARALAVQFFEAKKVCADLLAQAGLGS